MADAKLTELPEETAPAAADLTYIVDDVAGTPTSKKTTLANLSKGIVGGADTQVQFNDAGSLGGDAGLTYDKTANALTVGSIVLDAASGDVDIYPENGGNDFEIDAGAAFLIMDKTGGVVEVDKLQVDNASDFFGPMTVSLTPVDYLGLFNAVIATFTGLDADYKTLYAVNTLTATDGTVGKQAAAIIARSLVGPGGEAFVGVINNFSSVVIISGAGDGDNEYTCDISILDFRIGTGYTQTTGPAGGAALQDLNLFGPIDVQPKTLDGIVMNAGNYYNGSPSGTPSGGIWVVTRPQTGGGIDAVRQAATSYPIDVGLGIVGYSGPAVTATPSANGFTVGIQIGGHGSGWMGTSEISRIGTAIDIRDHVTRGIYIHDANSPAAMVPDIETTGIVRVQGQDIGLEDASSTTKITDQIMAGDNITITEVAGGDAIKIEAAGGAGTVYFMPPTMRLTTESGVPVSTSDRTAQGTLYWTPHNGGVATYYTGSVWATKVQSELSLSLTLTSGKNYDVFYNGTALSLSSAWTNDTTRADALGTQDGVVVLGSDHTKLWIGTIRASGTDTTEDSAAKRFVWNTYNRVSRKLKRFETTASWNYNTATWRQANAPAANQVEIVTGLAGETLHASISVRIQDSSAGGFGGVVGFGIDSTTAPHADSQHNLVGMATATNDRAQVVANIVHAPALGYHTVVWLERGNSSGTLTWTAAGSDLHQSGIIGSFPN